MLETPTSLATEPAALTVPLQAEQLDISRQRVAGDTIRVATTTREHEHEVDETIIHETVEVTHVPIGREIATAPEITRDGDLTIIPVVEEIVVVTRKLILKEEIHLRRIRTSSRHQETVLLRKQEAVVTREPPNTTPTPTHQGESP